MGLRHWKTTMGVYNGYEDLRNFLRAFCSLRMTVEEIERHELNSNNP